MRVLLDTHALAWWWLEDRRLAARARRVIANAETRVLVSAASIWEIAIKHRLGKWPQSGLLLADLDGYLGQSGFDGLPMTLVHALAAGRLDVAHTDPFDRMLIAQSRVEDVPVITADPVFAAHGVAVIWH